MSYQKLSTYACSWMLMDATLLTSQRLVLKQAIPNHNRLCSPPLRYNLPSNGSR